jgi:ribosomal protein S18 acetylase RimI-like enzyme
MLFSEFNSILGADGVPDEVAFLPGHVNVSPEEMERRLQRMAGVEHVLVAHLDQEPAGLACLRLVPYIGQDVPYAELTQLYVRERFQRQGVGAALIAATEERAAAAGATAVHIITGRNNIAAQAFYRNAGYESDCIEFTKYLAVEAKEREPIDA